MATRQISSDMGDYMSYIKFVAMSYATKHVLKMQQRRGGLSSEARSSEWERKYRYYLYVQSSSFYFRMMTHMINWFNSLF
jgi:hypothetical protein